jgi:predicted phosphate transport protein (TIGR00153 family)
MRTTNPLGRLFGPNPFTSLQEHMRVVIECVDHLPALFDALLAGDADRIRSEKDLIFEKEEAADGIHKRIRDSLPKRYFLPVSRRDLLDLLQKQDDIADTAQDIAGLLFERDMDVPDALRQDIAPFVRECVNVAGYAASVVEELDELLETGFGGKEADSVQQMIEKLHALEHETDRLGMELTRALFRGEDDMNPVSVVFWHRLIEWIGDIADHAESVGNRIRLLIAH